MDRTEAPRIHAAIAACMAEVGGVAKGRKNPQQGYMFRGIADISLACQPVMARHGVHVVPHRVVAEERHERETKTGGLMTHIRQRIEFRFYATDGSFVTAETTGEAMDTGDKTSNKVMSAALKYALIQTFCIPEEDPEIDTETQSPEPQKRPAPPPAGGTVSQITKADPGKVMLLQTELDRAGIGNLAADDKERTEQRLAWLSEALGVAIKTRKDVSNLTDEQIETAIGKARAAAKARMQAASAEAEKGKAS